MQKDIKCPQCGSLFGKEITVATDKTPILTIKNRDLYRSFKGGIVWGPCRNCAVTVSWPREE
jgi:hypothetical protein